MKIKALLATLIGAAAINGATAGEWCPPAPEDKCPVQCCPEVSGGNISMGYGSDYIWNGVRFLEDHIIADVHYTFDGMGLPIAPTIGVTHITGLGSGTNGQNNFDWTQLYAGVSLPELMGMCASLEYRHHFFPTLRSPSGTANNNGDSFGEISLRLQKEIACGVSAYYEGSYFLGTSFGGGDAGDWFHELGATKTICLTDAASVNLTAGIGYNDNLWGTVGVQTAGSGWNNYFVEASAPICITDCATLSPYVGYNGTPDGWEADGVNAIGGTQNANDVLYWGVRLGVNF